MNELEITGLKSIIDEKFYNDKYKHSPVYVINPTTGVPSKISNEFSSLFTDAELAKEYDLDPNTVFIQSR